jgi:hypothetical protein
MAKNVEKDNKSVTVDGVTYGLMDAEFGEVQKSLETAFIEGVGCFFNVVNAANRIVTLYINAKTIGSVVVNTGQRARPTEI